MQNKMTDKNDAEKYHLEKHSLVEKVKTSKMVGCN